MANSGGMTTAYKLKVRPEHTTYPSSMCVSVAEAVRRVRLGEEVIIQGSDMDEFRRELAKPPKIAEPAV